MLGVFYLTSAGICVAILFCGRLVVAVLEYGRCDSPTEQVTTPLKTESNK